MDFKRFMKKERIIWHKHFLPSFFAAIIVAVLSFAFEITISNIILFASVGASAVILTNSTSHHLTRLHVVIVSYVIAIVVSYLIYFLNITVPIHMSINIFSTIFLVGILLYLSNSFHPPAITASLSFLLLERQAIDLVYLFISVILMLIAVRFVTYTIIQELPLKKFLKEFKRSF
ncbi:MAG: HPP family protein [Candidatus Aenigmatarchaeota archaeon]